MLAALIRFSLTQRLFILLLVALTAGLGTRAFLNLPIDAFPDVSNTQVKIIIKAPGMTPRRLSSALPHRWKSRCSAFPTRACCARWPSTA